MRTVMSIGKCELGFPISDMKGEGVEADCAPNVGLFTVLKSRSKAK